MELPLFNSSFVKFKVHDTTHLTMHPDLSAKYPDIRMFHGIAQGGVPMTVDLSITDAFGLHAQIWCPYLGKLYIDPHRGSRRRYISYSRRVNEARSAETGHVCHGADHAHHDHAVGDEHDHDHEHGHHRGHAHVQTASPLTTTIYVPSTSRQYDFRIAIAANAQYCDYHGGSTSSCQAAVATSMNRVNGVYKREWGVNMQLVANNDQLMCIGCPSSLSIGQSGDALGNDANTVLSQAATFINNKLNGNVFNSNGYDIGHVYTTGSGGRAIVGGVCNSIYKAQGTTGTSAPDNDAFWIDYVSHEIGHQFAGQHTWNGRSGACLTSNWQSSTAYEPGSGTTIMAYAGICGADNVQTASDPYYHLASLSQTQNYLDNTLVATAGCGTITASSNNLPTVTVSASSMTIPKSQPFVLVANQGSDADSDQLTYAWEQIDQSTGQASLSTPSAVAQPRFRSYSPTTTTERWFPPKSSVIAGTTDTSNQLPSTNGVMNFAVVVRDHYNPTSDHGYGSWNADKMSIQVLAIGPLTVTTPAGKVWAQNKSYTVFWDPSGTTFTSPNVTLMLSVDGGANFAYDLGTFPNNGNATITAPCVGPTTYPDVYLQVRSVKTGLNYWYALTDQFRLAGGSSCNASYFPTAPPTTLQPIAGGTPAPTPQVSPTNAPTRPPTPAIALKIEFTMRLPTLSYSNYIANAENNRVLLRDFQTTVKAAATGVTSVQFVERQATRLASGSDTGVVITAHVDFDSAESGAETAAQTFSSGLINNTIFTTSNGFNTGTYGSTVTQNITTDRVAAPVDLCAFDTCHFVIWEAYHNTIDALSVYALAGDQVIFYWSGDEQIWQVGSQDAYDRCDLSSATKLTTTNDEANGHWSFYADEALNGADPTYLVSGLNSSVSAGAACQDGLKATIYVNEIRPKKKAGLGEGSIILITIGFMVFSTGIFLLWWFCCREEDIQATVHADDLTKSSINLHDINRRAGGAAPSTSRASFARARAESKRTKSNPVKKGNGKNAVQLPPGWSYHFSPDGSIYYYNEKTGESQWTCPTLAIA